MTQAQTDAYVCGISPHEHDPRFAAQHMAAYVFARPLARGLDLTQLVRPHRLEHRHALQFLLAHVIPVRGHSVLLCCAQKRTF